jgi:glycosyltransferase involved in cell wall biosynthesis
MTNHTSGRPCISVITVVFNGETTLEGTIESVLSQTYPNIQYIVVDGGSKDRSLEIIHSYKERIDRWVSEPDKGIYDAMNKGVAMATGEWIIFMNAGDCFYSPMAISDIFLGSAFKGSDIIYGDCDLLYANGDRRVLKAGDVRHLWKGMICSHQSLFARRSLFGFNRFDTSSGITSASDKQESRNLLKITEPDFEFLYECYLAGKVITKVPIVVSIVAAGGRSYRKRFTIVCSHFNVVRKHGISSCQYLYYACLGLVVSIKVAAHSVLPRAITRRIIKLLYGCR